MSFILLDHTYSNTLMYCTEFFPFFVLHDNILDNIYNIQVIDAIADAISATEGCSLLDVDPGSSTNRTVYTFVGPPEAVIEGALNAARVAFKLIDMTKHSGTAVVAEADVKMSYITCIYLVKNIFLNR